MSTKAQIIDFLLAGYTTNDGTGEPLVAGTVTVTDAGTSNAAVVWDDRDKTLPTTAGRSVVTLDAYGRAEVYGDNIYKFVIKDSLGATIETIDFAAYSSQFSDSGLVVADMVAETTLSVGDFVKTSGYTTIGDGGDNEYEIVAAGTGTDDGGSYIDLVTHQAKGLFPQGSVNTIQFGAIRGATDSAPALESAFAFLKDTGGQIDILSGGYAWGTSPVFPNSVAQNITVSGYGAEISLDAGTQLIGQAAVEVSGLTTIQNLTVLGLVVDANDNAIFGSEAVLMGDNSSGRADDVQYWDITFKDIVINNVADVVNGCRLTTNPISETPHSYNVFFINVEMNGGSHVLTIGDVQSAVQGDASFITNCQVINCRHYGVAGVSSSHLEIGRGSIVLSMLVDGFIGSDTVDVGLEFNNVVFGVMRNCDLRNNYNNQAYLRNRNTLITNYECNFTVENCLFTSTVSGGIGAGFAVLDDDSGLFATTSLALRDCLYVADGSHDGFPLSGVALKTDADEMRNVVVSNYNCVFTNYEITDAADMFQVFRFPALGNFTIENCNVSLDLAPTWEGTVATVSNDPTGKFSMTVRHCKLIYLAGHANTIVSLFRQGRPGITGLITDRVDIVECNVDNTVADSANCYLIEIRATTALTMNGFLYLTQCDVSNIASGSAIYDPAAVGVSNDGSVINDNSILAATPFITFGAADTTPNVSTGSLFITGGAVTITQFIHGHLGQKITIFAEHAVTITNSGNIILNGSADFVMASQDTLTLISKDAISTWYEVSRSDN